MWQNQLNSHVPIIATSHPMSFALGELMLGDEGIPYEPFVRPAKSSLSDAEVSFVQKFLDPDPETKPETELEVSFWQRRFESLNYERAFRVGDRYLTNAEPISNEDFLRSEGVLKAWKLNEKIFHETEKKEQLAATDLGPSALSLLPSGALLPSRVRANARTLYREGLEERGGRRRPLEVLRSWKEEDKSKTFCGLLSFPKQSGRTKENLVSVLQAFLSLTSTGGSDKDEQQQFSQWRFFLTGMDMEDVNTIATRKEIPWDEALSAEKLFLTKEYVEFGLAVDFCDIVLHQMGICWGGFAW